MHTPPAPGTTRALVVPPHTPWTGHRRSSQGYRRTVVALVCAGLATFAQLYSPQGILPMISSDLRVAAPTASLTVSAATLGLALAVLPWSVVADRIGRVRAIQIALIAATTIGLLAPFAPTIELLVVGRFLEGAALGGVPALAVTLLHEEIHSAHTAVVAGMFVGGVSIGGLAGRVLAAGVAELAGWRVGLATVSGLCVLTTVAFVVLAPRARGFVPDREGLRHVGSLVLTNLRDRGLLVLYANGALVIGGFVTIYNYLGFRLEAPPYLLSPAVTSLVFFAYLGGTVSSRLAGSLTVRWGRRRVLAVAGATMSAGALLTLAPQIPLILLGLVILTASFFGAHAVASGWVGHRAVVGRSQATSLYNAFYYAASSLLGWLGGVTWVHAGWPGVAIFVAAVTLTAPLLTLGSRSLRTPATGTTRRAARPRPRPTPGGATSSLAS
ncbi:MFS transporter [Oerskovia sp. USHLN155]|uniref:MFS transporter n=1 Tax=Oerskovia sp. USHLN155 TaxID=3081288 RepID=UPI003017C21F